MHGDAAKRAMRRLSRYKFEGVGKGTVQLSESECRQRRDKVSQIAFKHQCEEVTADGARMRHSVFRPQLDFGCESQDFAVNRRADHSRYIFVFGDKGPGYDNVKSWFCATLWYALACSVNLSAPHERACSAMSARAWRAMRFRCLRNIAPSLDSVSRRRSRAAYWRNAARTRAERLRRRGDVSVSLSNSLEVASSMAIVFMLTIIAAVSDRAQELSFVILVRAGRATR